MTKGQLHHGLGRERIRTLRKKSVLCLILGGAALHRCSKCIVLNTAFNL
jgi:hypothetical protein